MSRSRRAMTLLEVVLAMTALASISTLVAALWSQTRDWTAENASHHRLLATERALSLLTAQWESRVLMISLGPEAESAVTLDGAALQFITTEPILNRDSPLARVTCRIVRTGGAVVGESANWRLEYAESRVLNPASAASGATGSLKYREETLTLIDNADDMRWETWIDERGEADMAATGARFGWFAVRDPLGIAAVKAKSERKDETLDDAAARASQEPEQPSLRAGRLVCRVNGEEFAWQFIAARSR